jgi:hypothetical protein
VLLRPNRALSQFMLGNFVTSGPRLVSFLSQLLLVQLLYKGQGPLVVADGVWEDLQSSRRCVRLCVSHEQSCTCRDVLDIVCLVLYFSSFIFI